MEFFRETLDHLKRFFRVSPVAVAYDLHPNYLSTRFALSINPECGKSECSIIMPTSPVAWRTTASKER